MLLCLHQEGKARTVVQGPPSKPEWRCGASSWAAHASWPPCLGSAISLTQCPPPWDFCVCSCQSRASCLSLLISWLLPRDEQQSLFMVMATHDPSSSRPFCPPCLRHLSSGTLTHLPNSVSVTHPSSQEDRAVPVNLPSLFMWNFYSRLSLGF